MSEEFVDVEADGPKPGDQVAGKYVLRRLLGQGGYGSVWEGENLAIGKKVAIKLIEPQHATSTEVSARFRREARAAGALESDHVVQVYDVGEDPELGLYLVMELLRGEDLRHKLDRAGKIDVDHAVDWAHQIALGLAKAHAAGVVHRDLKPANVFLHDAVHEGEEADAGAAAEPVVKLVDFGVSKLLSAMEPGEQLTVAGRTVGTPQYMSPEQVLGQPSDPRGDLWGLGVLLFEMLAGRPPYPLRETFRETAMAIAYDDAPSLADTAPEAPAALVAVVARALMKDPNDRFPDGTAFAEALVAGWPRAFEGGRAARRVGPRPPPTSRSGRRSPSPALREVEIPNAYAETLGDERLPSGPHSPFRQPVAPVAGAPVASAPIAAAAPRPPSPAGELTSVPVAIAEATTRVVAQRQHRLTWLVAGVILASAAVIVLAILTAKPKAPPLAASEPAPSASPVAPPPPPSSAPAASSTAPVAAPSASVAPSVSAKPVVQVKGTSAPVVKPESEFGGVGVSSSY